MSAEGYEQEFIKEAFKTNFIAPLGSNVIAFENEISTKIRAGHSVALASGTAAIHMALKASGVKEGDIVLCQSLTFSATANPIIYEKAIPVFVDSDYESWNMSPFFLEEALIRYPNAKAVLVVHLYGLSADMDKIVNLCKKYSVTLIEDAAESLGTTYKGQYTGTLGDYGVLSFNGNKIITTSGGGMLVSNNAERIQKVKFWSTQARDQARHYQHSELGYNYRMSNIVAGIGRGQLKVLDQRVQKKRQIFNYYLESLNKIKEIDFMPMNSCNYSNCWLTSITIKSKRTPIDLILELEKENIESRPLWKPMHLQPFFEKFDFIGDKTSDDLFNRGLCLPSDTKMTIEEQNRVIRCIIEFFKNG
jgi:dTDP-4-amino-4,6-dideoxygalactose transaminase